MGQLYIQVLYCFVFVCQLMEAVFRGAVCRKTATLTGEWYEKEKCFPNVSSRMQTVCKQ